MDDCAGDLFADVACISDVGTPEKEGGDGILGVTRTAEEVFRFGM